MNYKSILDIRAAKNSKNINLKFYFYFIIVYASFKYDVQKTILIQIRNRNKPNVNLIHICYGEKIASNKLHDFYLCNNSFYEYTATRLH